MKALPRDTSSCPAALGPAIEVRLPNVPDLNHQMLYLRSNTHAHSVHTCCVLKTRGISAGYCISAINAWCAQRSIFFISFFLPFLFSPFYFLLFSFLSFSVLSFSSFSFLPGAPCEKESCASRQGRQAHTCPAVLGMSLFYLACPHVYLQALM